MYCFNYHAAHRHLHSFPTRRSSDLAPASLLEQRQHRFAKTDTDRSVQGREGDRRTGAVDQHLQDRKSTRLNSSHRCISYAVFCLKKKTTRIPIPSSMTSSLPYYHEL